MDILWIYNIVWKVKDLFNEFKEKVFDKNVENLLIWYSYQGSILLSNPFWNLI